MTSSVNRPLSHGGHFESLENKKLCFCTSSFALDERLAVQNLLFQHCVIKVYSGSCMFSRQRKLNLFLFMPTALDWRQMLVISFPLYTHTDINTLDHSRTVPYHSNSSVGPDFKSLN